MKFDTNMLEAAWKPSGIAELLCFHIVVFFICLCKYRSVQVKLINRG